MFVFLVSGIVSYLEDDAGVMFLALFTGILMGFAKFILILS